jgi:DNA-directed RNA polymerase specialized sigma24 family protein
MNGINYFKRMATFASQRFSKLTTSNNHIIKEAFNTDVVVKIVKIVVAKYVSRGTIPLREKEDVVMSVIEKFFTQKEKIMAAFEGKAKLTTYFSVIINKMCCEVIRKESKHWYSVNDDVSHTETGGSATSAYETEKTTSLQSEADVLSKAFLLFNESAAKTTIFLSAYFDLPVNDDDIRSYSEKHFLSIKEILASAADKRKAARYDRLAEIVNLAEGKDVQGDAVRMWLNKQIQTLLNRLNNYSQSGFTVESLAELMEWRAYNGSVITKTIANE